VKSAEQGYKLPATVRAFGHADLEGVATIAVAQSTVDALGGLIDARRFMMSGRVLTTYEEGGQYYRQELSAEDSRRSLEQFVALHVERATAGRLTSRTLPTRIDVSEAR
jgi:hypothetical protein